MLRIVFLSIVLIPAISFSQDLTRKSQNFVRNALNRKNVDKTEKLDSLSKYNYCKIWLSNQESRLGFIGDNYQRFYIHFKSIIKDRDKPTEYRVYGKTRVKSNICEFQGVIKIKHIREIVDKEKEALYQGALKYGSKEEIEKYKRKIYLLLGNYTFYENSKQWGSGVLKGSFKSRVYFEDDNVYYDDTNKGYSDKYKNNLFVGIWKSYKTNNRKVCNWGNSRIPNDNGLDIGTGFFIPNKKYLENGWQNYYNAYVKQNKNALEEERKKWW